MSGSPVKRGNYGDWAIIDMPPIKLGCGGCKHYQEDGSCSELPVTARGLGKNAYKRCKAYRPSEIIISYNSKQNNCPYRIYVEATNTHVCNQIESERYSNECKLCEWFKNEYPEILATASYPVNASETISAHTISNIKTVSVKKPAQKSKQRSFSHASGKDENITSSNEPTQKTKAIMAEYEERIKVLTHAFQTDLREKEDLIQVLNERLTEQEAAIEQLKAENEKLLSELTAIKEEATLKAKQSISLFTRILRFFSIK